MIETIKDAAGAVVGHRVILNNGDSRHTFESRGEAEAFANRHLTERLHEHYHSVTILRYLLCEGEPAGGSTCGDELDPDAVRSLARRCDREAYQLAFDGPALSLLGEPARHADGRVDVDHLSHHDGRGEPLSPSQFNEVQRYAQTALDIARQEHRDRKAAERPHLSELVMRWLANERPAVDETAPATWLTIHAVAGKLPGYSELLNAHKAGKELPADEVAAFTAGLVRLYDRLIGAAATTAAEMVTERASVSTKRTRAQRVKQVNAKRPLARSAKRTRKAA